MSKKIIIIIVIIVVLAILSVAAPVAWYYWQSNFPSPGVPDDLSDMVPPDEGDDETPTPPVPSDKTLDQNEPTAEQTAYANTKYDYSLKFPSAWTINCFGEAEEEANVIWIVSDEQDLEMADGGLPRGSRMEVIVQELSELKEGDPSFPDMVTVYDWLEWQRTYQAGFDSESMGEPKDENVTVGGIRAVKTYFEEPLYEDMAKTIVVTLLDPVNERVFQIQYLGIESAFSENESVFDQFLESFSFGF
ncbi:hypothetical protein KJ969_02690 [Patescibacteria group bacterium]|nr:hypothetical protein [Patescibacteria group bacterium]MBU1921915.1 hypothetical protein [Patescibacteria group bacterium]